MSTLEGQGPRTRADAVKELKSQAVLQVQDLGTKVEREGRFR